MKTIKINTTIIVSLAILFTVSCKKDDEPVMVAPQQVMSTFLDGHNDPISTATVGANYSVGFQFTPKVNGKLTQLAINLPDAGDYKISIWDIATETLLTQTTVNQSYGNWANKNIPELSLEGQKSYAICFLLPNGVDYYLADNITLPMEMTNITVNASVAQAGDGYPVNWTYGDKVFGFVDFTFQADPQ